MKIKRYPDHITSLSSSPTPLLSSRWISCCGTASQAEVVVVVEAVRGSVMPLAEEMVEPCFEVGRVVRRRGTAAGAGSKRLGAETVGSST